MYKLSRTIRGHTGDIKAVKFTESGILSVSRDGTACIESQPVLELGVYLNSCTASSTTVYAGAQDGTIAGIDSSTGEQAFFMGHEQNVCALDIRDETLISGSWDKTARVWLASDPTKPPLVLRGHTEAVWAVIALSNEDFLTAGADKRIIRWHNDKQVQVYEGHTDAVRGLCLINKDEFASCSNDNTIRVWNIEGTAQPTVLHGHDSFVYSLAHANGVLFSAGEDRTVRVWEKNRLVQTVALPCVSQWSVDARGSDFVVGSSDHNARVFSCNQQSWATDEELKEFSDSLASSSLGEDQVGRIDESQLKPESHIKSPGKEGEIALVKVNGVVEAYQFSANTWTKVGQVLGKSSDGAKVAHNGKEYDYVFDVDIREGQPPLKLPFNNSDNPHSVAERFVAENDLPTVYIEQVVQFLIQNSDVTRMDGAYGGASQGTSQGSVPRGSAPTGSAPTGSAPTGSTPRGTVPEILRYNKPLSMNSFQIGPLARTFNETAARHGDDIAIESMLTSLPASGQELLNVSIEVANKWGVDDILCALDTLRLAIPAVDSVPFVAIISLLLSCLDHEVPKHAMLATRGLANLLARHDAYTFAQKNRQPLQQAFQMISTFTEFTKPMQIAVATFCLNAVLAEADVAPFLSNYAAKIDDAEASYRLALAIGVLATRNTEPARSVLGWLNNLSEQRSKDLAAAIKAVV